MTGIGTPAFWSVALIALLIVIGLIVCARLVALLVGPTAVTPMSERGWFWRAWGGFALILLAAAAWTAFAVGKGVAPAVVIVTIVAVLGAAAVVAGAGELLCQAPWERVKPCTRELRPELDSDGKVVVNDRRGDRMKLFAVGAVFILGLVTFVVVVLLLVAPVPRDGRLGYPALALITVLGFWYFGYIGLGKRLRVRLKAVRSDGGNSPETAAYVAARITTMGSHGPRGVVAPPGGADVTKLPSEAISALPATEGKLAAALLSLLQGLTSINPWHAEVVIADDETVTVELIRNGRPAATTLITENALGLTPDGPGDNEARRGSLPTRHELLTAAAAFILIKLSERHTMLEEGLCGARKWRSLACQVLAATEDWSDQKRPEQLYANALDKDRENHNARLGYLHFRCGTAVGDPKSAEEYVNRLENFCQYLYGICQDFDSNGSGSRGYIPLRLRSMATLVVARLDYASLAANETGQRQKAQKECDRILGAIKELTGKRKLGRMKKTPEEHVASFAKDMEPLIRIFWSGAVSEGAAEPDNSTPMEWFNQACCEAERRGGPSKEAVRRLKMAVGDPKLRRRAVVDPALKKLRESQPAEFWTLIEKPRVSDILAFTPYLDALDKDGVHFPAELLARSGGNGNNREFAKSLNVPLSTVQWMREICEVIAACPEPAQAVPWVNLLTEEGVETRAEIAQVLGNEVEQERLIKLAWKVGAQPLDADALRVWDKKLKRRFGRFALPRNRSRAL